VDRNHQEGPKSFCPCGQIGKVGSLKRSSFSVRIGARVPKSFALLSQLAEELVLETNQSQFESEEGYQKCFAVMGESVDPAGLKPAVEKHASSNLAGRTKV
jgi:hypothetical protein